jgi:hypothetical protein
MNKKILIGSIFAALLMLLVPFTAVAAAPSNDAPKEPNEKPETTIVDQIPTFEDPSTLTAEEIVRSIEAVVDTLRDLGDISTANAISQELSGLLVSNEIVVGTGMGPIQCALLKLMIAAYLAAAAYCLTMFVTTGEMLYYILYAAFGAGALILQGQYERECGGDPEDVALANNDLTDISGETYTTSGCNICVNS